MATATCWQCGTFLERIITPVSRREECSQCKTDIHACKMCLNHDAQNRTGCDAVSYTHLTLPTTPYV